MIYYLPKRKKVKISDIYSTSERKAVYIGNKLRGNLTKAIGAAEFKGL